jgi:hypothetical protein
VVLFAAVHESVIGTTRTSRHVRCCAAVTGIADSTLPRQAKLKDLARQAPVSALPAWTACNASAPAPWFT